MTLRDKLTLPDSEFEVCSLYPYRIRNCARDHALREFIKELESYWSAVNVLVPEAGRERCHCIDVEAWERIQKEALDA